MKALGYVQGRDIIYEHRFADGKRDLPPDLVAFMLRLKLALIVTGSNVQTEVVRGATSTTPIVAWNLVEPVENGFVASQPQNRNGARVDDPSFNPRPRRRDHAVCQLLDRRTL